MRAILQSSVFTLVLILVNKFTRQKPVNPMIWVGFFFFMLSAHLLFFSKAEATEFQKHKFYNFKQGEDFSLDARIEIDHLAKKFAY